MFTAVMSITFVLFSPCGKGTVVSIVSCRAHTVAQNQYMGK